MRTAVRLLALALAFSASPVAQTPADAPAKPAAQDPAALWQTPTEQELQKNIVQLLLRFGRSARSSQVMTRAKDAFELVIEYDDGQREARKELGFEWYGGEWKPQRTGKKTLWIDRAEPKRRQQAKEEWEQLLKQIGGMHRDCGLQLIAAGDRVHGELHLKKALDYDPTDEAAHKGLGREQHSGFFGTPDQVAFVERMKQLETDAKAIAERSFPAEVLPRDQLPEELVKTGFEFFGSKTANFAIWTRNSQDEANACAQWGERAIALMARLLGDKKLAELGVVKRLAADGIAFVNGQSEREKFLQTNPTTWKDQQISAVRLFDDLWWHRGGKKLWVIWSSPERLFDRMIGHVVFEGLLRERNEGLGQGIMHTISWLLVGTTITWYGALPDTVSGKVKLSVDPTSWIERLREQIDEKSDVPLQQIPRERLSSFRLNVRQKSFYQSFWLMVRHPDQWLRFYELCSAERVLMPERIEAFGQEAFGRSLADIDHEWREWASGDSDLARATGHGR